MQILVLSSGLSEESRNERLARECFAYLQEQGCDASFLTLKEHRLEGFDANNFAQSPSYQLLHAAVAIADGLVFASPVYNWGCSSELKKFVEYVGSTPPDGSVRGAFYDKVVSFVSAAGLPHSYMAFSSLASSMMLDFKCIVNSYQVYVHDRHWEDAALNDEASARLKKSMDVMMELTTLLKGRSYRSAWEI